MTRGYICIIKFAEPRKTIGTTIIINVLKRGMQKPHTLDFDSEKIDGPKPYP